MLLHQTWFVYMINYTYRHSWWLRSFKQQISHSDNKFYFKHDVLSDLRACSLSHAHQSRMCRTWRLRIIQWKINVNKCLLNIWKCIISQWVYTIFGLKALWSVFCVVLCLKINGSRQIEQVTFKIPITLTLLGRLMCQGSRVRPIWLHVHPNFSRVRLTKIPGRTGASSHSRKEKKSIRDSETLWFNKRHPR